MKKTITSRNGGILAFVGGISVLAMMGSEARGEGISADDPKIVAWADRVEQFQPGPVDIRHPEWGNVYFGSPDAATGRADAVRENPVQVVSLGDGGSITLEFTKMICDAKGPDFAVFENGFVDTFLELAFVEVSSDGVHFFRFPSISRTPSDVQNGPFDMLDASMVDQLAGKYGAGMGTPFDLADLEDVDEELLDVNFVRFVKIIDVVGSIGPYGSVDSQGNVINDPFPTPYPSGGFDLDAIGVINQPEDYPGWMGPFADYSTLPDWTEPGADPDEDGRPNFVEYVMNTNPLTGDSGGMAIGVHWERLPTGEEALRIPSFRARTEVEQTVQVSENLKDWKTLVALDDRGFPVVMKEGGYRVETELEGFAGDDSWWLIRERHEGRASVDFLRLGFQWLGSGEAEE